MISLLVILSIMNTVCLILMSRTQQAPFARPAQVPDERVESLDDELSEVEKERLARDESFDVRIAQIKDELAKQQAIIANSGISAEEMHPLVKNLPHNIISNKHGQIPDIEVAE